MTTPNPVDAEIVAEMATRINHLQECLRGRPTERVYADLTKQVGHARRIIERFTEPHKHER